MAAKTELQSLNLDTRPQAASTAVDPHMFGVTPPSGAGRLPVDSNPDPLGGRPATESGKITSLTGPTGSLHLDMSEGPPKSPAVYKLNDGKGITVVDPGVASPIPPNSGNKDRPPVSKQPSSELNVINETEEIETDKRAGWALAASNPRATTTDSESRRSGRDRMGSAYSDRLGASNNDLLNARLSYSGEARESVVPVRTDPHHKSRIWEYSSVQGPKSLKSLADIAHREGYQDPPTMRHFETLSVLTVTQPANKKRLVPCNALCWNSDQVNKMNDAEDIRMATVSADGFVRIYRPKQSRSPVDELKIDYNSENCIEFDSTGRYLATAGSTQDVIIQNLEEPSYPITLVGHDSPITTLRFPTMNQLLTASRDSNMKLWDTERETPTRTFNEHTAEVCDIDMNPQEDFVFVSGSSDLTVKFWDYRDKHSTDSWRENENEVTGVQYFKNGKCVMTCSADATCKLLDKRSGKILQTYKTEEYSEGFSHLQLSESGRYLFVSCHKNLVIFDVLTGETLDSVDCKHKITSLKMSPDYLALACSLANGTVCFVGLGEDDPKLIRAKRDSRPAKRANTNMIVSSNAMS